MVEPATKNRLAKTAPEWKTRPDHSLYGWRRPGSPSRRRQEMTRPEPSGIGATDGEAVISAVGDGVGATVGGTVGAVVGDAAEGDGETLGAAVMTAVDVGAGEEV